MSEQLTNAPSKSDWNRERETETMIGYNGSEPLLNTLESARREGTRKWECFGLVLPETPAVREWRAA
ncbi:MAG TPA: hypothetical protein VN688_12425 [Gemmataceae bacterium]|nr:hypothetical protein [Gemmataceae bacterium]